MRTCLALARRMVLAHVAISSPNFRSVLHSVKHASIPTAPHPVGKPDALITTIESNPTLSSDSRPSRSQSRSQSPSQSPSPSPPPSSAPTPEARPKQAHHHHHHHHHRRRRSTRGGATASVGGSIPALAANNNGHSNGSGVNGISTVTSASPSDRESRASSPVPWTTSGSNNTAVTGASANRARSMSNINSTDNNNNNNNNNNKMHQTSSRLLRMTDEDRPFTRVSSRLIPMLPLPPGGGGCCYSTIVLLPRRCDRSNLSRGTLERADSRMPLRCRTLWTSSPP